MLELLREPLLQFLGVLVVAALFAAVLLLRSRKGLSWEVFSFAPLFLGDERVSPEAELAYEDGWVRVREVVEISVHVRNAGNVDIGEEDYAEPLRFAFGDGALVLDAAVIQEEPEEIGVRLALVGSGEVEVRPAVMVEGDLVGLRFLVRGAGRVELSAGSIEGTPRGVERGSPRREAELYQLLGAIGFVISGAYLLFSWLLPTGLWGAAAGLAAVSAALIVYGVYQGREERRQMQRSLSRLREAQERDLVELPLS